jgi:hypothetical protein
MHSRRWGIVRALRRSTPNLLLLTETIAGSGILPSHFEMASVTTVLVRVPIPVMDALTTSPAFK